MDLHHKEPPKTIEINKTRTIPAKLFDWPASDYVEFADPGSSCSCIEHHLSFACPGCGRFGSIPVKHPKESTCWDLIEGDLKDPTTVTLAPSINCIGCCGWHGFLQKGIYVSC